MERLGYLSPKARQTMTFDTGTENSRHKAITSAIGIKCYFARHYASWQRGTNEHVNGLVRWYLLKGTDSSKRSDSQIARIEFLINNRPPENAWALKNQSK